MKKVFLAVCCLLCLGTSLWAKKGDTMYVSVEEAELKSGTGFFASRMGFLPYGSKVKVLAEDGRWIQVDSAEPGGPSGWLPSSSLTKKKILVVGGLNTVSASADELALAGKGFSAEVEAQYTTESTAAIYAMVDNIEAAPLDVDGLLEFIVQGGLSSGGGDSESGGDK